VVLARGPNNDLFDLEQSFPALASTALDTKKRFVNFGSGTKSVGVVKGAFPETTKALKDTAPTIAFGRPYTPELFSWFDDFSTTGPTDAEGGFSRVYTIINAFDLSNPAAPSLIPLGSRGGQLTHLERVGQFRKCPGSAEQVASDNSNAPSAAQRSTLDCVNSARSAGNIP
jgi:hypothetical protein